MSLVTALEPFNGPEDDDHGGRQTVSLRTAAWYGDEALPLTFPADWQVETFWPRTPAPLTDAQIEAALEHPVGQAPIRELALGKLRPLIVVDDLTRPTPVGRVLPFVLRQLEQAGVPRERVTIVLATGTHGQIPPDAIARKVGPIAAGCRLLAHDCRHNLVRLGTTSFGSPVIVNREVASSDLLIGIGGVYPQHTAGFGGGSKLTLGVLGRRSIVSLHYGHPSMDGSYETKNDFRRDLDEMARIVGLNTMVSLHVDADRQPVRIVSGDHHRYYAEAVAFAREAFRALLPGDADVVVSNAYPIDVSLTFMRSKGVIPLLHAAPSASRVLISACPEGIGYHGLYPFMNGPRFERRIHQLRRVSVMKPGTIAAKALRRLTRIPRRGQGALAEEPEATEDGRPIWLFAPGRHASSLPEPIPGMTALYAWDAVLDRVRAEQGDRPLRVAVYPAAPLHVLDLHGVEGQLAVGAGMGNFA